MTTGGRSGLPDASARCEADKPDWQQAGVCIVWLRVHSVDWLQFSAGLAVTEIGRTSRRQRGRSLK